MPRKVDKKRLRELGFQQFGDMFDSDAVTVTMYLEDGQWHMSLVLPNGAAVACEARQIVAFDPCDH